MKTTTITKADMPDFIMVPGHMLIDPALSKTDCLVYGVVYWMSRMALKKCVASNTGIGKFLSISAPTVRQSLSTLEELGYVKRHISENGSNTRDFIEPLVSFGRNDRTPPSEKSLPPSEKSRSIKKSNTIHTYSISTPPVVEEPKVSHKEIIREYLLKKGIILTNQAQVREMFRRFSITALRMAKSGYSIDDIKLAMEYCDANYDKSGPYEWKLETVEKSLPNVRRVIL